MATGCTYVTPADKDNLQVVLIARNGPGNRDIHQWEVEDENATGSVQLFLNSLEPDQQPGVDVSVDGTIVTIVCKAADYADCNYPDGVALIVYDDTVVLYMMNGHLCALASDPDKKCTCKDDAYVSNLTTAFELEPGDYELLISCTVWPELDQIYASDFEKLDFKKLPLNVAGEN